MVGSGASCEWATTDATPSDPSDPQQREVTFVLGGPDLHTVAGAVAAALDVNLHEHRSPMVGSWYSDLGPGAIAAALRSARAGGSPSSRRSRQARIVLTANDPEPGVVPVDVPGGGAYVLRVWLHPDARDEVEARLRDAGTEPRRDR